MSLSAALLSGYLDHHLVFAEIEAACLERREQHGGHADWAMLCEQAGLVNLAFREWQLALRDDRDAEEPAWRLAVHYRERGEQVRAAELLERLLERHPAREDWLGLLLEILDGEEAAPRGRVFLERAVAAGLPPARANALGARLGRLPEEEAPASSPEPSDADLIRFTSLFGGREDVHARQWAGPGGTTGYSPVHEPFTPAVARNHLLGTFTVGTYPIRLDGTCTFLVLDLDVSRASLDRASTDTTLARELRRALREAGGRILAELRALGTEPLYEDSGYKGRHFWVFLEQPESAEVLHQLGRLLLPRLAVGLAAGLHLEYFPKQAGVRGQGLGNLIKLPLGIHRRTGRRAVLLGDDGQPLPQPFAVLRRVQRLKHAALCQLVERLRAEGGPVRGSGTSTNRGAEAGAAPPAPEPAPAWTEADFQADPSVAHLLARCPVLAELKRQVDQHRRLSHEEQLVLIHSLGHLPSGPLAVNYLLERCLDVGPEKLLKSPLRGNPVSCPSVRKRIGHVTRRVACNCSFEQAPDRYPTPVLHLLSLPTVPPPAPAAPAAPGGLEELARRFGVLSRKREEIQQEWSALRSALLARLRALPDRAVACRGGRYLLVEGEGVEELRWEASPGTEGGTDHARGSGHGTEDADPTGRRPVGDHPGR